MKYPSLVDVENADRTKLREWYIKLPVARQQPEFDIIHAINKRLMIDYVDDMEALIKQCQLYQREASR